MNEIAHYTERLEKEGYFNKELLLTTGEIEDTIKKLVISEPVWDSCQWLKGEEYQKHEAIANAQLDKADPQGAYNRGFGQGKFEESKRIIAELEDYLRPLSPENRSGLLCMFDYELQSLKE